VSVFSSMATIQGNSPKSVLVLVFTPMMRVEVAVTPSGFTTPQPGYSVGTKIFLPILFDAKIKYN
jgi:hypothetical protein